MKPLEERIKAEFATNEYPGDDRLTVYDSAGRDFDETFQLLRGKSWQEFPARQFAAGDTPIPDLSPEAFHYYMPALLIAALSENDDSTINLTFQFTPSTFDKLSQQYESSDFRHEFHNRMALFTPNQRAVIADVLRECVARGWETQHSAGEAIDFLTTGSSELRQLD